MSVVNTVTWYVARACDGQFSHGESWVHDIANARLYRSIGPAKSAVTKRAKQHPGEPVAEILEWKLDIATATLVDVAGETSKRIAKAARAKELRAEAERKERLNYLTEQEKRIVAERERLEGRCP